jgi:hypothetical protein
MASWVDLPEAVANLRYVPEMIVALLADQKGHYVQQNHEGDRPTWFAVGRGFEDNVLLKAFHQGLVRDGPLSDRTADRFQEQREVGLDQLLMIRLAQQLEAAPRSCEAVKESVFPISDQFPSGQLDIFPKTSVTSFVPTQTSYLATHLWI